MLLCLLFISLILLSIGKQLDSDSDKLQEFKNYCSASYMNIPQEPDMTLKKLILFHRHGDRAPLTIHNTNWHTQDCKKCKLKDNNLIENCVTVKCEDGLLSIKGYTQMVELGKFLKQNYPKTLFTKIKLRSTAIERTQTSLHGVYFGLTGKKIIHNVTVKQLNDDSLIIPMNCPFIDERINNKSLHNQLPIVTEDDKRGNMSFKIRSDQYFTALCNKIDIDCDRINCDDDIIFRYLSLSNNSWSDEANVLLTDEEILSMIFGRFVDELKEIIEDEYTTHLISVHDRSLAMLMAGLGIKEEEHPPYASAIFMEIWENDQSVEFVRIIYNDKTCDTIIDENCNILLEKFLEYIKVLRISEDKMKEKCKIQLFKKSSILPKK